MASARLVGVAQAALLAACSSAAPSAAPSTTTEVEPARARASVRFFSERDGFARETQSIVSTDRFHVRVDGVPPRTEAKLALRLYDPWQKGRGYTSSASFVSDDAGTIDTGTMAPRSGSYAGVDPDGLVWSAELGDLAEGLGPRTAAFFTVTIGEEIAVEATLDRRATAEGVTITPVQDGGLHAELYMPEGARDRIPVVAFGGSEGGLEVGQARAMQIASWGHPVLAVAYFGAPGIPSELADIPLEYFGKAFAWLDARPETRKGKAVVVGVSRGGELALQLGVTFPNVVGVVAETPSSLRWPGFVLGSTKPAWTWEGKSLAYVPPSPDARPGTTTTPSGATAYVSSKLFEADLAAASPEALEAARIRVETSSASFLMIGGSDDAMWPACEFIDRAMKHLAQSGHAQAHGDEGVCIAGAGHMVGDVGVPTTGSMWADLQGEIYALGGSAAANARAGRETSDKMRAFLERVTR